MGASRFEIDHDGGRKLDYARGNIHRITHFSLSRYDYKLDGVSNGTCEPNKYLDVLCNVSTSNAWIINSMFVSAARPR